MLNHLCHYHSFIFISLTLTFSSLLHCIIVTTYTSILICSLNTCKGNRHYCSHISLNVPEATDLFISFLHILGISSHCMERCFINIYHLSLLPADQNIYPSYDTLPTVYNVHTVKSIIEKINKYYNHQSILVR